MKKILFCIALTVYSVSAAMAAPAAGKPFSLSSPDGSLTVEVSVGENITWSVNAGGITVLAPSGISMNTEFGVWGADARVTKEDRVSVAETIAAPLYKQNSFDAAYNGLTLRMRGDWGLEFRAYDGGGAAYRFVSYKKKPFIIRDETVEFGFDEDYKAWYPYSNNSDYLLMSFENTYQYTPMSAYDTEKMAFLPVLIDMGGKGKVFITESDVESYPGMYVNYSAPAGGFKAVFPRYPAGEYTYTQSRMQERVVSRKEHIAEVKGARNFPWRIIRHITDDRQLPVDNMVYQTASPSRVKDTSWIKGGKSAWDWWNNWGLSGVDFKAGINTETYKYYADFCAGNGLEYFILDEGWSPPAGGDIMKAVPEIDLKEIVDYAASKGVKVLLWTVANVLDEKLEEACRTYSEMGFAGFKVDFIDRQDQLAVERIYRIAEMAAKYKLVINYHGIYKPTGLSRTYPNVVNYEGVWGLEQLKWTDRDKADMPTYDVTAPFIRMAAGPMDYTQGAMKNASKANYRSVYGEPMSQGTRAHQVAAYIVFDSPMVMLCDSPTNYLKERETLQYISRIPAVFDNMEILDGRVGEYIVTMRRSGPAWFVGGLTGWDAREVEVDLSFLPEGVYEAAVFMDGENAGRVASDYRTETVRPLESETKMKIKMASGGGFAMRIVPARQITPIPPRE